MNTRLLPLALAIAVSSLALPASALRMFSRDEAADPGLAMTDRLIVKYRSGAGPYPTVRAQVATLVAANRHGVVVSPLRQMAGGAQVFRLSKAMRHHDVESLASSLKAGDPNVEFAEPDRLLQPLVTPNDALFAQQWSLSDATAGIRAPLAWDRARGAGITVAVIDTGVLPHADLLANLLPGYDFVTDVFMAGDGNARDADAADPGDAVAAGACAAGSAASKSSWHGTHVAGIVAASGGNALGVTGVAFGARILPLRVLGRCGGYTSDIADAMVWAVGGTVSGLPVNANPARVLNLSLGGRSACNRTTQTAIDTARAKGAVVVVAAGNDNTDAATSAPANCSGVVVVTATGKSGGKASYANTGAIVTLAAPGGDTSGGILSTLNTGTAGPLADSYASAMGTSMATPVVAGVAALMLSANPRLAPDQVASLLKASARAFPTACANCGAGLVDANAAVTMAAAAAGTSTPTPAPTPTPVPTSVPTPTPVAVAVNEVEPNDAFAKAQAIAVLPAALSGTVASHADVDHFKLTLAGGKTLTATLTAGASAGFGLSVLNAAGQSLLVVPGAAGRQIVVTVSNGGSAAAVLVLKVQRSTGLTGAYKLALGS